MRIRLKPRHCWFDAVGMLPKSLGDPIERFFCSKPTRHQRTTPTSTTLCS